MEGMYGLPALDQMGFTPTFMKAIRDGFQDILTRDFEDYERAYLLRVMRR
ncbi:unnamed protein product, partial [marine sediment metagenome]